VPYCETVLQPVRVLDETFLGESCPPDPLVRPGIRLAIDVGTARIGVAGCDPAGLLASPLATVRRAKGDLAELARLAAEREVIEVIVGLPRGLSGRESQSAADARGFAAALADLVAPVPVRLVDERFTTVLAHDALRQGGRDSRARRPVVAEQQKGRGPAAAEHQHRRNRADDDQPQRKLFLTALFALAFDSFVVFIDVIVGVAIGYVLGHCIPNPPKRPRTAAPLANGMTFPSRWFG